MNSASLEMTAQKRPVDTFQAFLRLAPENPLELDSQSLDPFALTNPLSAAIRGSREDRPGVGSEWEGSASRLQRVPAGFQGSTALDGPPYPTASRGPAPPDTLAFCSRPSNVHRRRYFWPSLGPKYSAPTGHPPPRHDMGGRGYRYVRRVAHIGLAASKLPRNNGIQPLASGSGVSPPRPNLGPGTGRLSFARPPT